MRKTTALLSILVLAAMVLAACGGEETQVPTSVPPITAEATETMLATEAPTEAPTMEGTATDEPGVPVTGDMNPARVSNELNFQVLTQDGQQVGSVDDMILNLDNRSVDYVIVDTGGTLGVGGKKVAVPWTSLELQSGSGTGTGTSQSTSTPEAGGAGTGLATATSDTGGTGTGVATATSDTSTGLSTSTPSTGTGTDTGSGTGSSLTGMQNAFVLQGSQDMLANAPEFDSNALPAMGQSSSGWDASIQSYWQSGGTGGTDSTPAAQGTAVPDVTGTATSDGAGASLSTSTPSTGTGTDTGSGAGTGTGTQGTATLQGVVLASDVIGSTITVGAGQGAGESMNTATPDAGGTGTGLATSTPGTGTGSGSGTGTGTGTDLGNLTATVEDMIVDPDSGDIQFIVIRTTFDGTEHLIPVPLTVFGLDGANQSLILNADTSMLQNAPSFQNGQFPDTTMSGWDSEFGSFWQNNGAGAGSGTGGANPTATP